MQFSYATHLAHPVLCRFTHLNISSYASGHKPYGFHPKYLKLYSEDERSFYEFGTTWGYVINDKIFILGWSIPLSNLFGNNIGFAVCFC